MTSGPNTTSPATLARSTSLPTGACSPRCADGEPVRSKPPRPARLLCLTIALTRDRGVQLRQLGLDGLGVPLPSRRRWSRPPRCRPPWPSRCPRRRPPPRRRHRRRRLATSTVAPVVDPAVLADISMTSVPPDVIVPTSAASLDEVTNPINGRRGGRRPLSPSEIDCVTGTTGTCLTGSLDMLGFDVTSGSSDDRSAAGNGRRPSSSSTPACR